MALQLPLMKDGDVVQKLQLSLSKDTPLFVVDLAWASAQDLDAHALLASNVGAGAKIDALAKVLSTYTKKTGAITVNSDGSFSTPEGALKHSGDSLTGVVNEIDETITIDVSKVPANVNEIPIFVTIHKSVETGATFKQVTKASVRISNDKSVLCEYVLSDEFGPFGAVQMGSIVRDDNGGWEFAAVGNGFNGDFNAVLGAFS